MTYSVTSLITDIALASLLIFIAQILRSKIRIIQNLFLPAPLIAGFLGLCLGSQGLRLLPFSAAISDYPYALIVILFGSLFIGRKSEGRFKKTLNRVEDTFLLNMAAEVGQFGMALVLGSFIFFFLFPDLDAAFALLAPAGFAGGHGYAASIGGTLTELTGWQEAVTIGQTFATIGLILGVLVGLVMINYAIKKGYTNYVTNMTALPSSMRSGFFDRDEQKSVGLETTCSISIETLSWHFALVLMAAGGAYLFNYLYGFFNLSFSLPLVCLSMFCGVIINKFLKVCCSLPRKTQIFFIQNTKKEKYKRIVAFNYFSLMINIHFFLLTSQIVFLILKLLILYFKSLLIPLKHFNFLLYFSFLCLVYTPIDQSTHTQVHCKYC